MKRKTKVSVKKKVASKSKHRKPVHRKTTTRRRKTTLGKTSSACKTKMKKTIETLKKGLNALEKEIKK